MKDDKKKKKGKSKVDKTEKLKDENINEDAQADINEDDDAFGLPDVDFKPLDEIEEVEETADESVEESQDEGVDYENEIQEEETAQVEEEESYEYPKDSIENEFDDETKDFHDDEPEIKDDMQEEEKPVYTRKFDHPEEKSPAPKIIISILVILLIISGVWYFGFYAPQQKAIAEKAVQEALIAKQKAEEQRRLDEEQRRLAEEQRLLALEEEEKSLQPEPGQVNILTERTGRFYVVIGSFIDDDLAMDYGNELSEKGIGTMLLSPIGKNKFYQLALSEHASFDEAQEDANEIKGDYSNELWVYKY